VAPVKVGIAIKPLLSSFTFTPVPLRASLVYGDASPRPKLNPLKAPVPPPIIAPF